jgi:hypothetical protein
VSVVTAGIALVEVEVLDSWDFVTVANVVGVGEAWLFG